MSSCEYWRELCVKSGKHYAKEFAIKLRELSNEKQFDLSQCNLKQILKLFSEEFAQYLTLELNNCDNQTNNEIKEELSFGKSHVINDNNNEILGLTLNDLSIEVTHNCNNNNNNISINSNNSGRQHEANTRTDANEESVPLTETTHQTINENNNSNNHINTNTNNSNANKTGLTSNGSNCVTSGSSAATSSTSVPRTASHDDYSDLSDNETETESPKTHYRKFFRRLSFKGLRKGLNRFLVSWRFVLFN